MENNDTLEVIQRIPLDKLRPYPDHPFGVRDDDNMHIRDYKYTAEDVDCRYCTEFCHGRCRAIKCPWLNERIEAGVISYHDAVNESFSSRSPLLRRIRLVLTFYDKSFWKDDEHFRRFQQADAILGFYKSRNTNEYYSALFLLTADHSLFLRFLDCFNRREINFDLANLKGITPEHYALYKIAKSLYTGTAEVSVSKTGFGKIPTDDRSLSRDITSFLTPPAPVSTTALISCSAV